LQTFPSHAERAKFDTFVLTAALEKDLAWLTDIVLENSVITPELISILASTGHNNEIVDMLDKIKRPKFVSSH